MVHRIGIVGAGHWSKRLVKGIGDHPFEVYKTVDVLSYDEKSGLLGAIGVPRERHYEIDAGDGLPDGFLDGVDVVQVASPVEYHLSQTREALDAGKFVVTEKSYAADRDGFEDALRALDGRWDSSFLHLHYLNKVPTKVMPPVLERATERGGGVEHVEATFIEERNDEDANRGWLFEPENGGVMLDWVHPIEVLGVACGAALSLRDATPYLVEPDYSDCATAARAEFGVSGELFADGATATVNVGKGFDETHKRMRFELGDGGHVDFVYADSEDEFDTDYRGEWEWRRNGRVVESGKPTGPIPYEILIDELADAVDGGGTWVNEERLRRVYEPVWEYNEAVDITKPVEDADAVESFRRNAVRATEEVAA
jgi:predicted dehydrogenase